jgi:DNA topoisomerase-1
MLIYKIKTGTKIIHYENKQGKKITDKKTLIYIDKLRIPPAYNNVVIYYEKSPKILFTGIDDKNRKQYVYGLNWCKHRSKVKFSAVLSFAQKIPKIQNDINSYLKSAKFSFNKVMAMVLKLVMSCYFRIGNQKYEKLYGSYGVITMKIKHLTFKNKILHIKFIGKKGVENTCLVKDKILLVAIKKIISGKKKTDNVFQYYENNTWNNIKAKEVNIWLKYYAKDITTKAFRTYDTNIFLIEKLRAYGESKLKESEPKRKKTTNAAIKEISELVHNTLAICRKEYVHPEILQMYLKNPRKFKRLFMAGNSSRIAFIKFLKL